MNKVILSTGSDYKYMGKISPYLKSIEKNSNFDENILVFFGDENIEFENKKISFTKISKSLVLAPSSINCLQHGEFILSPYFEKFEDSDVIFFTDGDMFLQRNLSVEEKSMYSNFKDGDVYVGYNASPTDTLLDEAPRLGYRGIMFPEFNLDWKSIKVYNTGLVGMNKKTWKRLAEDYIKLYHLVDKMFTHYAKQQWLISFIINTSESYNVIEMPYHIHNHKHYPSPIGTTRDQNGDVFFENKLVMFRHKW